MKWKRIRIFIYPNPHSGTQFPGPAAAVFAPTGRFPPAPAFNTEVADVRIQAALVEGSLPMAGSLEVDNH